MHCFGLTCQISVCCRYWLIGGQHYVNNVPLQELIFYYVMSFLSQFLQIYKRLLFCFFPVMLILHVELFCR